MARRRGYQPPFKKHQPGQPNPDVAVRQIRAGTFAMPAGIPSVSGGASPAVDFAAALSAGNPEAVRIAQSVTEEASLADLFVAATYQWARYFNYTAGEAKRVEPIPMHYRQAMLKAHKFVLDNQFVEYATMLSSTVTPEKLLYRLQFATLPYDKCWIEFDLHAKVRTMRAIHGQEGVPAGVGQRLGLLCERINETATSVTMVADKAEGFDNIIAPNLTGYIFCVDEQEWNALKTYNMVTPFAARFRAKQLAKLGGMPGTDDGDMEEVMTRVGKGSLWGFGDYIGADDKVHLLENSRDFLNHVRIPQILEAHGDLAFSGMYDFFEHAGKTGLRIMDKMSDMITTEVTEFAGMMRWLVIVLAMLNEVPTRTNYVQPSHQIRVGLTRTRPAFDHHVVSLKLPKTKPVPYLERYLSNVERRHKAHMVRSHWRHFYKEPRCAEGEHQWLPDWDNGYQLCEKCFSFATLVHEHARGDASLGWTHKSYAVKLDKQRE